MSLLMQALKKAERAKQGGHEMADAGDLTLEPLSPAPAEAPDAEAAPARNRQTLPPAQPPSPAARRKMPPLNARSIRIALLASAAMLIAATFAYLYWRAMYGPGSSRNLPMVPMPGLEVVAATEPAPAPPALPPAPAPSVAAPPPSREQMPPDAYARPAPQQPSRARADDAEVRLVRARKPDQINPHLLTGFAAYQRGDLAAARQSYQSALRQDASNRDALLGMAALAVRDKQVEQAAAIYARLLAREPNDDDALAGLASMRQAEPGQGEERLRRALERDPEAAPLLFELGNLYARQGRWTEAQQYYFRAHSSEPDNPDYAFNLAIGLDRLGQGKLARAYYQRALELAASGAASFERGAAQQRVSELAGQ